MRRIPKSFKLLGHTIKVSVLTAAQWDVLAEEYDIEDCVGYFSPADQIILIKRSSKSMTLHTFQHELVHAILNCMNSPLNDDEAFVDNFAGLLSQAIQTAE